MASKSPAEIAELNAELLAALKEIEGLLTDWPTMRALSALGSEKATENKIKAREIVAAAIAKAEA